MEYPVELVPTTPRHHITGTTALNIPATYRMGGDWHKHSTWFSPRPERLDDRDVTTEQKHGRLLDRLGLWGLRDARGGLAELGHPGADSRERVWAATYDRAVIEESWELLTEHVRTGARHPAFDQYELQRLLGYPDQWIRLRWWGWRLRAVMTAAERDLWDEWRKEWWPWDNAANGTRRSP